jgi:hypothetical protein
VTGWPEPLRLVRQVPSQRRDVASEAVTGAQGASQVLDFTPDEQASQPPDIALA